MAAVSSALGIENKDEAKGKFSSYREYLYNYFYNNRQKQFLNFYQSVRSTEIELGGPSLADKPSLEEMISFLRRTNMHRNLSLFDLHRRIAHFSFSSLPKLSGTNKNSESYASGMRFDYSPEAINLLTDDLISREKSVLDSIAHLDTTNSNDIRIENILYPMIKCDQELSGISNVITFLSNVHPSSDIRDASTNAETKLGKFGVDCGMREDVYKVIKALKMKIDNNDENCLNTLKQFDYNETIVNKDGKKENVTRNEWKRYLNKVLQDFERNGLDLEDEAKKAELKTIKKRMTECSTEFSKNLVEEKSSYLLTKDELLGMDEDWLKERYDKDSDKYRVTLKYPCVVPLMKKCSNWQTRKLFDQRFNRRCIDTNTKLMEELIELRCQQAKLLGKSSHSEHILDIRMAKKPSVVNKFLTMLSDKLSKKSQEELNILKKYKTAEMDKISKDDKLSKLIGKDENSEIMSYDFRYYLNFYEKDALQVDHDELKRYFPVRDVVQGALNIYQDMLGLTFELAAGQFEGGTESKSNDEEAVNKQQDDDSVQWKLWHDTVKLYRVRDRESGELMGHFLLDLYPREGKYGHACMCTLEPGCLIYEYDSNSNVINYHDNNNKQERKQLPVNAMLCNFPNPNTSPNPYLTHSDVVTFFHEFGHVMHQICGQTQLVRFSGTRVERDFVEAPSQMLENWCWYEKPLLKMSKIPNDRTIDEFKKLIIKLRASKDAMPGLLTKRQLFFGLLDQNMHSIENIEEAKTYSTQKDCHEKQIEIWGIPDWTSKLGNSKEEMAEKTNFVASFGHLAGGYDAQYYGYMWSEVYSADMFHTKFYDVVSAESDGKGDKNDDNKAGLEYRNEILKAGASRDAIESLRTFLGREPNDKAFLKEKGVEDGK